MTQNPDENSSNPIPKRLEPFLDCIAYLLARRWLRDQRQEAADWEARQKASADVDDLREE